MKKKKDSNYLWKFLSLIGGKNGEELSGYFNDFKKELFKHYEYYIIIKGKLEEEAEEKYKQISIELEEKKILIDKIRKEIEEKDQLVKQKDEKIFSLEKIMKNMTKSKNDEINNEQSQEMKKIIDDKNLKIKKLLEDIEKLKVLNLKDEAIPAGESTTAVCFTSLDQKIIGEIISCLTCDPFVKIEQKLYEKYPEFKEYDNYFLVNGTKIQRFKTIKENKIKMGIKLFWPILKLQEIK